VSCSRKHEEGEFLKSTITIVHREGKRKKGDLFSRKKEKKKRAFDRITYAAAGRERKGGKKIVLRLKKKGERESGVATREGSYLIRAREKGRD